MAGQRYELWFKANNREAVRAAREVEEAVEDVSGSTDALGDRTEEATAKGRVGLHGLANSLNDVRVQAGLAIAAIVKLVDMADRFNQTQLEAEGERWLTGMTQDEAQAVGVMLAAGGLDSKSAARDMADFRGALIDKAQEAAADSASGFIWDFETMGLDAGAILEANEQGVGALVEYLQRAIGQRDALTPEQVGAMDRLMSGDKRVMYGLTQTMDWQTAMKQAAEIPDMTAHQRETMQIQRLGREGLMAEWDAIRRQVAPAMEWMQSDPGFLAQLLRGATGLEQQEPMRLNVNVTTNSEAFDAEAEEADLQGLRRSVTVGR